jgi:hypothetical protein
MVDFRDRLIVATTERPLEIGQQIEGFHAYPHLTIVPSFQLLDGTEMQFDNAMQTVAERFPTEKWAEDRRLSLRAAQSAMGRRAVVLHQDVMHQISVFLSSDEDQRPKTYTPNISGRTYFPIRNLSVLSKNVYGGQRSEVIGVYELGAKK